MCIRDRRYGLDSIAIVQLNQELEKVFGPISKTLFFQHRTIAALAGHLAEQHPDACRAWTEHAEAPAVSHESKLRLTAVDAVREAPARHADVGVRAAMARAAGEGSPAQEPIAIVGIAGRYPKAETLDAFWENLRSGRDCIEEIPAERWPLAGFFEPDAEAAVAGGRSYSKWGGFLDGFADFDPLFFNICLLYTSRCV